MFRTFIYNRRRIVVLVLTVAAFTYFSSTDKVGAKRTALLPPPPPPPGAVLYDYDGDGKADVGRWHTANTEFRVKKSTGGSDAVFTLGSGAAAPGDFNGDGTCDAGTFSSGTWTYKTSTTATAQTISLGASGDIPVAGDYDADGITDAAVFRPSNATWYVKESGKGTTTTTAFGASGDIPIPGNYDGTGKTDFAVYRIWSGYGYFYLSLPGGTTTLQWGQSGDIPVQGDFDGDGKSDPGIYRPSTGEWWVLKSSTSYATYISAAWGSYGDQPVPADYDGDGKSDFSVWRPTTGVWFILKSSDSNYSYKTLGVSGDQAIESAYTQQVGGTVPGDVIGPLRLKPINATGGTDLYSQNFGWGTTLVSLPGRAGLDLNLGISANSLVWLKSGSTMYYDPDHCNVGPGFKFGFPTIEPAYYDSTKAVWTYLMVTPSGARLEFRQQGAGSTYETFDSSYTQLTTSGASSPNDPVENITITVKTTDGTQMSYDWKAGAFRCSRILDRNGNFITVTHDTDTGVLTSVTDTLGRVVNVSYDADLLPTSITQTWKTDNGKGTYGTTVHTWASFAYTTKQVAANWGTGITAVIGPPNNMNMKVLDKITYADGSATKFDYNGYLQVTKASTLAPDSTTQTPHVLNYVSTNLSATPSPSPTDCPRFTQTNNQAENFNSGNPVVTTNTAPASSSFTGPNGSESTSVVTVAVTDHPNTGFNTKIHFAPSSATWKEGLTIATEDCLSTSNCTGTNRVRWTWNDWEEDRYGGVSPSYTANPRVKESRVGDDTNTKQTTTTYLLGGVGPGTGDDDAIAYYGLPSEVKVCNAGCSTVLKTQTFTYNTNSNYINRRIIGLPSEVKLYEGTSSQTLMSKVTYTYDGTTPSSLTTPTQHLTLAYGTGFNYRGNATTVTRWDVGHPTESAYAVSSSTAYNIAGSPVSQTDPRGRVTSISYSETSSTWNDGVTRTTYAYPTGLTDPGGFSSTIKYRFDFGANVWARSPTPYGSGNTYGKTTSRTYDDAKGRIIKDTIDTTGAYTEYEYNDNGTEMTTYSTIVDTDNDGADADDEVATLTVTDGSGRVLKTRTENPNSSGGYTGKKVTYDILGRVTSETNPTEINSSWAAYGDDSAGFRWNHKEYDWKGRVLRTIPSDSTGSDGKDTLIEYAGCGCAGGQITTIKGPQVIGYNAAGTLETSAKRRMQKFYEDILGRTYKTEIWDFAENGPSTPYSTTKTTFNGRDQATLIREYVGSDSSLTYQDTAYTYDGHGRVATVHKPKWFDPGNSNAPKYITTTYNADDTIASVTDPRGAVATYTYETVSSNLKRPLVTNIAFSAPTPIPTVTPVQFDYDDAGNRKTMTDSSGTVSYTYDELSRLKTEARHFADAMTAQPTGGYVLTYAYNLGGGLKSIIDPFSHETTYSADKTGRTISVGSGSSYPTTYADNISYRAFGSIKSMSLSATSPVNIAMTYDDALRPATYTAHSNANHDDIHNAGYTYGNDGLLTSLQNNVDAKFSQVNKFDFAGRVKINNVGTQYPGPGYAFQQSMAYDGLNNLTTRTTQLWGLGENTFTAWYTNNRKTAGGTSDTYDLAGSVIASSRSGDAKTFYIDASGKTVRWEEIGPWGNNVTRAEDNAHDADGRMVKRYELERVGTGNWVTLNKWHYLYSTVTGQKITEIAGDGYDAGMHVYMGAAEIATYLDGVTFKVTDPVTGSTRVTTDTGEIPAGNEDGSRIELAGLGTYVTHIQPTHTPEPRYIEGGDGSDSEGGCEIDGTPMPCNSAARLAAWIDGLPKPTAPQRPRDPRTLPSVIPATALSGRTDGTPDFSRWHWQDFAPDLVFADGEDRQKNRKGLDAVEFDDGHEGSGYGWMVDPMRRIVEEAKRVLRRESCRNLFDAETDPTQLLEKLITVDPATGTLTFGQIVDSAGNSLNARAYTTAVLGPPLLRPGLPSISTGLSAVGIVLTNGPVNPRFGLNEIQDRALTLIHELGHAANYLRNKNGEPRGTASGVLADDPGKGAWVSQFNSDMVWMKCFMTDFGSRATH
jgi:hypothetical protein